MASSNFDKSSESRRSATSGAGLEQRFKRLLPLVYDELRAMASAQLAREGQGPCDATSLVHEAVLRLTQVDAAAASRPRAYLFGAAAIAMRRVLVERARAAATIKRGGPRERRPLSVVEEGKSASIGRADRPIERWDESLDAASLLSLDEALTRLEAASPRKARVVMLRFYGGLTNEQAAAALDLSVGTVKNDWRFARAWLRSEIDGTRGAGSALAPGDREGSNGVG